jgi:hypothetical protein
MTALGNLIAGVIGLRLVNGELTEVSWDELAGGNRLRKPINDNLEMRG